MPKQQRPTKLQLWLIPLIILVLSGSVVGWIEQRTNATRLGGYEPQAGDIIFQSLPRVPLVDAIEGATQSPYSHCGIVARERRRWVVYEALGRVGATSLKDFVNRGRNGGSFDVYRLKAPHQKHVVDTLSEAKKFFGRPYDVRYRLDDEKIYCSELIYKAYFKASGEELGELVKLGSLAWGPHEALIRQIESGPVPVDRLMITPRDMAQAKQLERVFSKKP